MHKYSLQSTNSFTIAVMGTQLFNDQNIAGDNFSLPVPTHNMPIHYNPLQWIIDWESTHYERDKKDGESCRVCIFVLKI